MIVLDAAGYGAVVITQAVALVAPPGVYAGISVFSGTGVTVNASGARVRLSGLTINGQGGAKGIAFTSGNDLNVDRCAITGMIGNAIDVTANPGRISITDSRLRGNGNYAINIGPFVRAALDRVRVEENVGGLYAQDGATVTVSRSVFARSPSNPAIRVVASSVLQSTTSVTIDSTLITRNGSAVLALTSQNPSNRADVAITRRTLSANFGDGIDASNARGVGTTVITAADSAITQTEATASKFLESVPTRLPIEI